MKTTKYPVENSVITNNFRTYYMELYNKFPFFNITAFAKICNLSFMSASRYLLGDTVPRYLCVMEKIEDRLGKPRGDFFTRRETVEWYVQAVTWAHPPRPEANRNHTQIEPVEDSLVAEDELDYHKLLTREMANDLYTNALMKAYIEMITKGESKYDEGIVKLITTPRL